MNIMIRAGHFPFIHFAVWFLSVVRMNLMLNHFSSHIHIEHHPNQEISNLFSFLKSLFQIKSLPIYYIFVVFKTAKETIRLFFCIKSCHIYIYFLYHSSNSFYIWLYGPMENNKQILSWPIITMHFKCQKDMRRLIHVQVDHQQGLNWQ